MIDLYFWPTPNGFKITLLLEELAVPYTLNPINLGNGDQFHPDFLKISPNNRMPAIIDQAPVDGGAPISVFESGAILKYLASKYRKFYPTDVRAQVEVDQWLFWQMGGLGPMSGQAGHFRMYATEKIPYAIDRYTNEVKRLYGVMDRRLTDREFLAGEYSIADMASWPWIKQHANYDQNLEDFPNLKRWFDAIAARPAVIKGSLVGQELRPPAVPDDAKAKEVLFDIKPSLSVSVP